MAVRQINTEEVPIASINENPKSNVRIAIKNTPPPMPKRPDAKPTKRPMIAVVNQLNGILAFSLYLLILRILFAAINKSKHPKIISKTLDGSPDATKPPIAPPIIPKMPKRIPGWMILSNFLVCLYAPLRDVGTIIARLVASDINIAKSGSTPIYFNRKYWRGTIKNPPPTPKSPDAKPAQIPINANPMKYSIVNMLIYLKY